MRPKKVEATRSIGRERVNKNKKETKTIYDVLRSRLFFGTI